MKVAMVCNRLALGGLTAVCPWDNLSGEKASCPNSFFINMQVCVLSCFSHFRLCATPWTVAHQAPLSVEFSRQESWSGLPFLSPGDLPKPAIKPGSPPLQADSLPSELPGKPKMQVPNSQIQCTFHYIHSFLNKK